MIGAFFFSFCCWTLAITGHNKFLAFNEHRTDLVVLNDRILNSLPTFDVSVFVSVMTAFEVGSLAYFATFERLVIAQWCAIFMLGLRTICMFLTPLKVHPLHIPLSDTFLDTVVQGHPGFKNDLLFSGHVGHCLIAAYVVTEFRYLLLGVCLMLACALLLSKTHYTIDILVTPFFMFPCFQLAEMVTQFLKVSFN